MNIETAQLIINNLNPSTDNSLKIVTKKGTIHPIDFTVIDLIVEKTSEMGTIKLILRSDNTVKGYIELAEVTSITNISPLGGSNVVDISLGPLSLSGNLDLDITNSNIVLDGTLGVTAQADLTGVIHSIVDEPIELFIGETLQIESANSLAGALDITSDNLLSGEITINSGDPLQVVNTNEITGSLNNILSGDIAITAIPDIGIISANSFTTPLEITANNTDIVSIPDMVNVNLNTINPIQVEEDLIISAVPNLNIDTFPDINITGLPNLTINAQPNTIIATWPDIVVAPESELTVKSGEGGFSENNAINFLNTLSLGAGTDFPIKIKNTTDISRIFLNAEVGQINTVEKNSYTANQTALNIFQLSSDFPSWALATLVEGTIYIYLVTGQTITMEIRAPGLSAFIVNYDSPNNVLSITGQYDFKFKRIRCPLTSVQGIFYDNIIITP